MNWLTVVAISAVAQTRTLCITECVTCSRALAVRTHVAVLKRSQRTLCCTHARTVCRPIVSVRLHTQRTSSVTEHALNAHTQYMCSVLLYAHISAHCIPCHCPLACVCCAHHLLVIMCRMHMAKVLVASFKHCYNVLLYRIKYI